MTRRRHVLRRLAARLGLFALLFQAILFGWHHHGLPLRGALPAPVVENPAGTPQLADDDEDHCGICQVLHHLTAAPADTGLAPPRPPVRIAARPDNPGFAARSLALAFHARAPPPPDAAIG